MVRVPVSVVLSLLLASALAAEARASSRGGKVKVEVQSDGTKVILNEGAGYRASRLAGSLRELDPTSSIARLIDEHATARALSPRLVQAVIQVESGYNQKAVSNKGAKGLMQLIDGTAADLGVANPFDAAENIRGGTAYLRKLWDTFGNLELALAAYNAGPGAVERHGGIPPYAETEAYVDKVLHLFDGSRPFPGGSSASSGSSGVPVRRGLQVRLGRDTDNRLLITNVPSGRRPP